MSEAASTKQNMIAPGAALRDVLGGYRYPLYSMRYVRPSETASLMLERAENVLESDQGFQVSYTDGAGLWCSLIHELKWETDFFGSPMARLECLVGPHYDALSPQLLESGISFVSKVVDSAKHRGIKHLSCSVDTNDSLAHASLERNGFTIADTICCYLLDCNLYEKSDTPHQIRPAQPEDKPLLYEISSQCFGDRQHNRNRFNSDAWFPSDKVSEMYGLWATRSVEKLLADETFVFSDERGPLGFATAKLATADEVKNGLKIGKVMLNAVTPQHQGKKIYAALAAKCIEWFKHMGMEFVEIRTQLPNIGIHRVWQKLNSTMVMSYHTFHRSDL